MIGVAIVGAILIAIFSRGFYERPISSNQTSTNKPSSEPALVSIKPSDNGVLAPSDSIEINFNQPLENSDEFKHRLEPKTDYKLQLSDDKKTIRFVFDKPLPLGTTYTLFIQADAKFEGKKTLGKDLEFHFRTIAYNGV